MPDLLEGLRILVLEDEFLIAMELDQLCREHGARDVRIVRTLMELEPESNAPPDAAIVDVMLEGRSTLDFAKRLRMQGVPFVFASGYMQGDDIFRDFPGVAIVGKPYSGDALIGAVSNALNRMLPSGGI